MADLFASDPSYADLFAPDPSHANRHNYELPSFALIVSATATGQWHSAALVREVGNPYFFVRSLSVSWPFLIARPAPSTRQNSVLFRPDQLSPTRTSPASKLVVNWAWRPAGPNTEELRFFVRRRSPRWVFPKCRLELRLRLKEQAPPQRRHLVQVISNPVDWRVRPTQMFAPHPSSRTAG